MVCFCFFLALINAKHAGSTQYIFFLFIKVSKPLRPNVDSLVSYLKMEPSINWTLVIHTMVHSKTLTIHSEHPFSVRIVSCRMTEYVSHSTETFFLFRLVSTHSHQLQHRSILFSL